MKREYPAFSRTKALLQPTKDYITAPFLLKARNEGRIRKVYSEEYIANIYCAWDLGFSDSTAIWWYPNCWTGNSPAGISRR